MKYLPFIKNFSTKRMVVGAIRKEDGVSLIEVAIGLMVLGLIVTPFIQIYNSEIIRESKAATRGNLVDTVNSINQYYSSGHGAYPCPASISLNRDDTDFGKSGDCTLVNIKLCASPTWITAEGICKTDNTNNAVIIGGTPFATLKMSREISLDYWNNKIIYAVTFEQTNPATFILNDGQISVNAVDSPADVIAGFADGDPEEKTNSIDFFLFSTGRTARGGFTKDGIAINECGNADDGYESENCDFDNRFFYDINPDNDTASAFSEVIGINFYDDITRAQDSVPEATWFPHPENATNSGDFVMTMATKIGVGTKNPQATIDVVGNIRADGDLQSNSICNNDGTICFDPELITGTRDEMRCNAEGSLEGPQAIMKLSENKVFCNTTNDTINGVIMKVDTNIINPKDCGAGVLISGIDANGDVKCVVQ